LVVALLLFLGGGRCAFLDALRNLRLFGRLRCSLRGLRGLSRGSAHRRGGLGFGRALLAAGRQAGSRERDEQEFQFHC
jgi:hypothetical protein